MAVTFDLFETLVTADRPAEPWTAVADELASRGISVPSDWEAAYRSSHVDADPSAEISLIDHTMAALESRDVYAESDPVESALLAAFDGSVTVLDGADAALAAAAEAGPVALLSNCSLPGLVRATLERADFRTEFDAIVTSVDCGWRKPHDEAFDAAAAALGVSTEDLVHVGDDPRTDGGGTTAGVTVLLIDDVPLSSIPAWLETGE